MTVSDLEKEQNKKADELPFVAQCRVLDTQAPFRWIAAGWGDFRRAPVQSLTYGLVMMFIASIVAVWAIKVGTVVMAIVMMAGFGFMMPALAMGVYSISCQLERGQKPRMWNCIRQGGRHMGNAAILAFALLIVFLLWARASSMMHIFFPDKGAQEISDVLMFGGVATLIFLLFSTVVISVSAFSIPMIMDRKVDAVTAMLTSINAVRKNKKTMFIWFSVIVAGVISGAVMGVVGLMVTLPVLGHATWHGYRETILANDWPQQPDTVVS